MNKEELIKYSISYIESRIQQVDNKANILIAIQAGFFATITWVSDKLFLPHKVLAIPGQIIILVSAVFAAVIVGLLLQTLRPTKTYFSNKTNVSGGNWSKGIMWPKNKDTFTEGPFKALMANIDSDTVFSELENTLFVERQLVDQKYWAYRYAVLLTKIETCVVFVGVIVLVIISLCRA